MTDPVAYVVLIAGSCFILWIGARLGAGSSLSLGGLWAARGRNDWPQGVQEADAPRFEVAHADALRPGTPIVVLSTDGASRPGSLDPSVQGPALEMIELDEAIDDLIRARRRTA